jgi:hypothetical protein
MTTEAKCQVNAHSMQAPSRAPGPARSPVPEPRPDWAAVRDGFIAERAAIVRSLSTAASLASDGVLSRRPSTASAHLSLSRTASAASDGR